MDGQMDRQTNRQTDRQTDNIDVIQPSIGRGSTIFNDFFYWDVDE